LEPAAGDGAFLQHMPGADWCELSRGRDFFEYDERVDWIVTNPPWSQIRPFLTHSFKLADHVVFLMTVNHAWTKARLRAADEAGFKIAGILLMDTPWTFPQSGFQLGAVYYQRGWKGDVSLTTLVGN
jgi:hypothetical protein